MSIKTFYIRDEKNFPVACVATQKVMTSETDGRIYFAVSSWSPLDRDKHVPSKPGIELTRHIAIERLKKTNGSVLSVTYGEGVHVRIMKTLLIYGEQAKIGLSREAAAIIRKKLTQINAENLAKANKLVEGATA